MISAKDLDGEKSKSASWSDGRVFWAHVHERPVKKEANKLIKSELLLNRSM